MTPPLLHALCVVFMLVDIWARAWRIEVVLAALSTPISLADQLALTTFADAAAALSPWRLAGEPARVFGATHAGVSAGVSVIAMGLDSIVTYVVLFAFALVLGLAFGREWAAVIRGGAHALTSPAAIVGGVVVVVVGAVVVWRLPRHIARRAMIALIRAWRQLRAAPPSELAMLTVLSVVSLAARVAILPVVALAFGEHPPAGTILLASFSLTNGQVLVPTPSGAGAVELAAAAGVLGTKEHTAGILAAWRLYVTILPILIGIAAGANRYGRRALLILLRRP